MLTLIIIRHTSGTSITMATATHPGNHRGPHEYSESWIIQRTEQTEQTDRSLLIYRHSAWLHVRDLNCHHTTLTKNIMISNIAVILCAVGVQQRTDEGDESQLASGSLRVLQVRQGAHWLSIFSSERQFLLCRLLRVTVRQYVQTMQRAHQYTRQG